MATPRGKATASLLCAALSVAACTSRVTPSPTPTRPASSAASPSPIARSHELVVVTTPDWNATAGMLRRFTRASSADEWREVNGSATQVVVGATGLAWGTGFDAVASDSAPHKHEGDGRSPAGVFPLDTAFGFAPPSEMSWVKLPYVQLAPTSDCVDDTASAHYNTVVDRALVPRVDWNSAEHMRQIRQYEMGVIVGYNATPPRAGRGSCIFLHIWSGPTSHTAGCTAFDPALLRQLIAWLDPREQAMLVQLPEREYARLRTSWDLPAIPAQQPLLDWANLGKFRDANASLPPSRAGERRVVFMGNSITEAWAPFFAKEFPGKPYIGRGISGQTTPQMLVRFRQDVVALKPAVVVILAGTNDIAGNTGPSSLEMIEDNIASMTEIAQANGIRVVLASVLPAFDYPWRRGLDPAPKIVALDTWIKAYAERVHAVYADIHSAMADARGGMREGLSRDGVHPTEAGYQIMAPIVERAIAEALR